MKKLITLIVLMIILIVPMSLANKPNKLELELQHKINNTQYYVNTLMYKLIKLAPNHFFYYKYRPHSEDWYIADCYLRTVHSQEYNDYLVAKGTLEELKELQAYSTFNSLSK